MAPPQTETQDHERRYIPRWETRNRIYYRLPEQQDAHQALSRDISCTGACLSSPRNIPPRKPIILEIQLSEEVSVSVKGETVWSSGMDGSFLVGVHFENVDPQVQETILEYAFNLNRDSLHKHWFNGW